MIDVTRLAPHDPLPERGSVILMRRFAEDAPDRSMLEIVVTRADGTGETSVPVGSDGAALEWDAAIDVAKAHAEREGFSRIWTVDRLGGDRERVVASHGGDRSAENGALADDDLEEGIPGSDLRDQQTRQAPRKF